MQIVAERLCEAVDLRAGSRVLDVAAGNGNTTLAAARRWCDVTSTDKNPAVFETSRKRAEAECLKIKFVEADAEKLPFPDQSYDVVLSAFGVMMGERVIRELLAIKNEWIPLIYLLRLAAFILIMIAIVDKNRRA